MSILQNSILQNIVVFSGKSLVYSVLITVIGLVLSWILYRYIVIGNVSLKKALFEKDNFAAWAEFIGAFIFPVFYLSAKVISVERSAIFSIDILYGILYVVMFTLGFTVLRIISDWVVYFICKDDQGGKINLYKEVYEQKNIGASLFSISFAVVFANMISNITFGAVEELTASAIRILEILVLTLVFHLIYALIQRKVSLIKEIFNDNNTAAGLVFLGITVATQLILNNVINYRPDILDIDIVILSSISFIILLFTVFVSRLLYSKILKVKLLDELYKDNNSGAALGEVSLFIGVALIITHLMV